MLLQYIRTDDHGIPIVGQKPAALQYLGLQHFRICREGDQPQGFTFAAIGPQVNHAVLYPTFNIDHARKLTGNILDAGYAIGPLKQNLYIILKILESVFQR